MLDQFADVGDWEPMHRPLIQVMAVIVSISLVVAGVGTVLEVLLAAASDHGCVRSQGAEGGIVTDRQVGAGVATATRLLR